MSSIVQNVGAQSMGMTSHRGFGFSLGHPNFQLPSTARPINPNAFGRASSLTPDRVPRHNLSFTNLASIPVPLSPAVDLAETGRHQLIQ